MANFFIIIYDISSFSGESVEENANLVIRLLIRRPECLGPALRGEGEGLLRAIIDANKVNKIVLVGTRIRKDSKANGSKYDGILRICQYGICIPT